MIGITMDMGMGGGVLLTPCAGVQVAPAVVNLVVEQRSGAKQATAGGHHGGGGAGRPLATGSGVVVRADGLVLTNAHVVAAARSAGGEGRLRVNLPDGRVLGGKVLRLDRGSDLALVQVAVPEGGGRLAVAVLADRSRLGSLRVGEWCPPPPPPPPPRHHPRPRCAFAHAARRTAAD